MALWARRLMSGPYCRCHPMDPRPIAARIHDRGHDLELDQPGDCRHAGIFDFQMLGIGTYSVGRDAITRRSLLVEEMLAVEPRQPAAVSLLHCTIGVLRVGRPAAPLFEQIAGLQCGLPLTLIPRRPLFWRSAAALRAAQRYCG